jgi:hypothetical protein
MPAFRSRHGKPVANPLRNTAFQASALRTSLYTSVMAFNVADLVVGLGFMILVLGLAVGGVGFALAGLAFPSLARKVHVEPVAAPDPAHIAQLSGARPRPGAVSRAQAG